MDNTLKMAALLRTIRTATNGAVVGAMESRGVEYGLSYGVAVVDVRRVASQYGIDHQFAKLTYRQQVRELRLAATYMADPDQIEEADADFWTSGIESGEIAENVAMMMGHSVAAEAIAVKWLGSEQPLLQYAALMTATHSLRLNGAGKWDLRYIASLALKAVSVGDYLVGRGVVAFITRAYPLADGALDDFIGQVRGNADLEALWREIEWILE